MFDLPEYPLIAAILPIAWAIYLKHTSGTEIQIHFVNLDYRTTVCIRNGTNNTLFVDDAICYKSHRHKHIFYSIGKGKSVSIAPGEELRLYLDIIPFLKFIEELNLNERELVSLRIKLNTSKGVLTSGWIKLIKNVSSQYKCIFDNNPRANVLKMDLNPICSESINPVLAAIIVASFLGSFFIPYETMANIVMIEFLAILIFGPFTFIQGFKNSTVGSLICLGLGLLMGLMLPISAKDFSYIIIGAIFFIVIYLEAMICSGGITLNSE